MLSHRPSTRKDAERLSTRLRDADVREIMACGRETVLDSLLAGLQVSDTCETIVDQDGLPLAMYGCSKIGCIWMLASDDLLGHKTEFLRRSREIVEELQVRYGRLWNAVWAENHEHIKWLRWCGFTIEPEPFYLPTQQPFLSFYKHV